MRCTEARTMLSPYLDGVLTGVQMRNLGNHLSGCGECSRHYTGLRSTQQAVAGLGRKQVPEDVALRLRVALSHAAAESRRNRFEGLKLRWENACNAFMVPATAGVLTSIIIFGLLIGFFALPATLRASNNNDVMLYTPPQLVTAPFVTNVGANQSEMIVVSVEADIDANGRVQGYRIVSASRDPESIIPELENTLIFMQFQPARSLGLRTSGKTVLSFAALDVKG
ncbi:MAG: anti-sigma factor family protein [Terriglobales bacterium]